MSTAMRAFAAAIVAITVALPAYADPPGRVGRLSLVSGSVSLAPAGLDDQWSEAYVNRPITTGDRLWTAERSRAEIRVGSAAVRLDATTSADMLNVDDRLVQIRLGEGRMQLRVRALPPDGLYEIDTPGAAVVIREPGVYRIDVRPDADVTTLVVRNGGADISGSRASIEVRAGESIAFENGGESYDFRSLAQQDDFDRFYLARDARDDQRRPRYVSVEMTGYEDLDENGSWSDVAEYGNVWFPTRIDAGWVPYRDGRWVWVEPWGWTWVDNAAWGFAPFHYGRWVRVRDRWGWCPGEINARPVYAPALVAWVGGPGFSVSVSSGAAPVVGWFPLAYREPYVPWYETSPTYLREVNLAARVTNINVTNINVTQFNYKYRRDSVAVTAVPATVVTQAQPVTRAAVRLPPQRLEQASIVAGATPVAPARQSVIVRQASARPPASVERRQVVAVQTPPPAPAPFSERERALAQRGNQPFKVQPLPPRAPTAASASGAGSPTGAASGATAPAPRAPVAGTTAVATVAPVRVIKPPPAQARIAGAPPPSARAPAARTPETAGARDTTAAPPGRQANEERARAAPATTERPNTPGAAAVAPPRMQQAPKAATEPPKAASDAAKQAPQSPTPAGASGPSSERPGPVRENERARPSATPTAPPRELAPSTRAMPESALTVRTPPERAAPRAPVEQTIPSRAAPVPLPDERVAPVPERATPREMAPPTPRAAPPSPERIVPQAQERGGHERAAPAAPAPRVAPQPPVERAAPRETPKAARPSPERSVQPMPERAAPAAPTPERAAPREAPAAPRAAPPSQRGAEGAGRAPPKEQPEKGRSPDEKAREEQRG